MIRKLTPAKINAEQMQKVQEQLGTQEISKATPKSTDPINFPVFEVPVNSKLLIYVPNHVTLDKDGIERLRMDMPLIHSVQDGKRYLYYRCISGIIADEAGFHGDCPLCDGCQDPWSLANEIIAQKCKVQGLDPEDTDNKDVKAIRSAAFGDRVVKDATRYYTFPIVVLETVNNNCKDFLKDEEGNLIYKVMWYSISESQYEEKWRKALDMMEDEPTHPGGNFFILNFMYTPKNGEPNKRDSARALQVGVKNLRSAEKLRAHLDEITKDWTPEKAQETVCNNILYPQDELEYVADAVLENTRNLLAVYQTQVSASGIPTTGGDGFVLEKKETPEDTSSAPAMDDTDLDVTE